MTTLALAGKVAIVAGGVRRIGRAIARALAVEGASVVVAARTARDEAQAVIGDIQTLGARAAALCADVSDDARVRAMADTTLEEFGRVDIPVNNASLRQDCRVTEMTMAEWRGGRAHQGPGVGVPRPWTHRQLPGAEQDRGPALGEFRSRRQGSRRRCSARRSGGYIRRSGGDGSQLVPAHRPTHDPTDDSRQRRALSAVAAIPSSLSGVWTAAEAH